MKFDVILLAAGLSTRFGSIKQNYKFLNHQTMIEMTINKLKQIDKIGLIIVVNQRLIPMKSQLNHQNIIYTKGGTSRTKSLFCGLNFVKSKKVIVHDGARPFLTVESWKFFVAKSQNLANLICARRIVDSLKLLEIRPTTSSAKKIGTVNQHIHILTETPQMFVTERLIRAQKDADHNRAYTDEIDLISHTLINSRQEQFNFFYHTDLNPKITFLTDLITYRCLIN